MSYTLPSDVDGRSIAIDGAGTLGRRIGTVYAAGGTDVRIFDVSRAQREAARDCVTRADRSCREHPETGRIPSRAKWRCLTIWQRPCGVRGW